MLTHREIYDKYFKDGKCVGFWRGVEGCEECPEWIYCEHQSDCSARILKKIKEERHCTNCKWFKGAGEDCYDNHAADDNADKIKELEQEIAQKTEELRRLQG